ncbi:MAG: CRISPR-associated protein Cas5 [Microcystaceae cyanobacterium]
MESVAIHIEVPLASFPQSHSREYQKTYLYPPHSTVYGLLLSMVGEFNPKQHCGAELAMAMLEKPQKSKVLRQFHRFKHNNPHDVSNWRPDFQELLTDLDFIVWVRIGKDKGHPRLYERLIQAILCPESVNRYGYLYLGQSTNLVDSVALVEDDFALGLRHWLIQDEDGGISLPYWVDFDIKGTQWNRYRVERNPCRFPPDLAWTRIEE